MVNAVPDEVPAARPIWLKIWQFPLVALIVAVVLIVLLSLLSSIVSEYLIVPNFSDAMSWILGVAKLVLLLLIAYKLVIRRLGTKKHDDLPLDNRVWRDTGIGFGVGALLITVCVGVAALLGVYRIEGMGSFADWPEIIFLTGVYAGFFEELLMRGVLLRWLEEMVGSWIALIISALVFGFLHAGNDNATFFSSLAIAIEAGTLLGAAYMLTRSLWFAIGLHAGWNVVQAMWDVPVSGNDFDGVVNAVYAGPELISGGAFGLEASVVALVVATGAGIWMLYLTVKRGRIVKPMWSRKGAEITAY